MNDHTDVWFIGYSPTYVTGVWMGYPGRKKNLGNGMTGGVGALPFFIEFMKDFLKDKPQRRISESAAMPEDMQRDVSSAATRTRARARADGSRAVANSRRRNY